MFKDLPISGGTLINESAPPLEEFLIELRPEPHALVHDHRHGAWSLLLRARRKPDAECSRDSDKKWAATGCCVIGITFESLT